MDENSPRFSSLTGQEYPKKIYHWCLHLSKKNFKRKDSVSLIALIAFASSIATVENVYNDTNYCSEYVTEPTIDLLTCF